ncbi:hypothetical protein H8356DRAFT_1433249, partial [Neocallimastix lanati (nom. inval.)]
LGLTKGENNRASRFSLKCIRLPLDSLPYRWDVDADLTLSKDFFIYFISDIIYLINYLIIYLLKNYLI